MFRENFMSRSKPPVIVVDFLKSLLLWFFIDLLINCV